MPNNKWIVSNLETVDNVKVFIDLNGGINRRALTSSRA
jgi:hypothetical protein